MPPRSPALSQGTAQRRVLRLSFSRILHLYLSNFPRNCTNNFLTNFAFRHTCCNFQELRILLWGIYLKLIPPVKLQKLIRIYSSISRLSSRSFFRRFSQGIHHEMTWKKCFLSNCFKSFYKHYSENSPELPTEIWFSNFLRIPPGIPPWIPLGFSRISWGIVLEIPLEISLGW